MANEMDGVLQQLLTSLSGAMANNAEAMMGRGQMAYVTFASDVAEPGPERFDTEMADTFSEDGLASTFSGAREGDATAGDVMFYTTQYGLLARLGRDFRMRRRTKARIWAHGATRARALGAESGPIMGSTIEKLKRMMTSGNNGTT